MSEYCTRHLICTLFSEQHPGIVIMELSVEGKRFIEFAEESIKLLDGY